MKNFTNQSKNISIVLAVMFFYYIANFLHSLIKYFQFFDLNKASPIKYPDGPFVVVLGQCSSFSVFNLIIPMIAFAVGFCVYKRCKYSAYLIGVILVIEVLFGDLLRSISGLFKMVDTRILSVCMPEPLLVLLNGIFPFALLSVLFFLIIKNEELFQKNK